MPSRRVRSLGAVKGVFVAAFATSATLVPALIGGVSGPRSSVVALWTTLGITGMLALIPLLRRSLGAGATTLVAGTTLGMALPVFIGASRSWSEPIVHGHWTCGTGDAGLVLFGLPVTAGLVALGGGVGTWLGLQHRRWLEVFGRGGVLVALALTVALLAALGPSLRQPEPDAWPDSVPRVAALHYRADESGPGVVSHRRVGHGTVLERRCEAIDWDETRVAECTIRLRPDLWEDELGLLTPCRREEPATPRCPPEGLHAYAPEVDLELRRDPESGIWIVARADDPVHRMAFDRSRDPTDVSPSRLGAAISAPRPAFFVAVGGIALAVLLLLLRLRVSARRRALRRGREGRSAGVGVAFDDGALPARGYLAATVDAGPVVAWPTVRPGQAAYRDDGTRGTWRAQAGTKTALRDELGRRATGLDLLALAVLLVSALPLLVAARTLF